MRNRNSRCFGAVLTATIACLVGEVAFANPETGGDYSSTNSNVYVTATLSSSPTVLRQVTVVCPVSGFLIAQADTQFAIATSPAGSDGLLTYSISRTAAVDAASWATIESNSADGVEYKPASISRFDTCNAGQSVTYRFVAYRRSGVTNQTYAWQPRLSVIHLRDRY